MKLDKRSKIFLIIFFSIILIPVIIIGTINYTKEQKLKNRIENSKATRTLTLNSISTSITLDELLELELSKEYTIGNNISTRNEKKTTITYTNTTFFGADCIKEYVFYDNKLRVCDFDIDASHWMPKNIYEELVKLNGEPDETDVEPDNKYHYDMYVWYGKNGTLVMVEDKYSRSIDVSLEIEER
jgi:hypothetical protein